MARKRRRRDRQRDAHNGNAPAPQPQAPTRAVPQWQPPSTVARVAGGALAILTLVIAVVTVISGFSGDLGAIDVGARLFAGLFLIALAIVIGALAIVPGFVRRVIAGG